MNCVIFKNRQISPRDGRVSTWQVADDDADVTVVSDRVTLRTSRLYNRYIDHNTTWNECEWVCGRRGRICAQIAQVGVYLSSEKND